MQKPIKDQDEPLAKTGYIGRFAPSPTGPLHFGSLLAALASFLDARANEGKWLMRVEDLDPPREPAGSAELILQQLQALGMEWDEEVLYQSSRLGDYHDALNDLRSSGHCYACNCTRPQIRDMGNIYDGSCRNRAEPPEKPYAIRLRTDPSTIRFEDRIQGPFSQQLEHDVGDFVLRRKDELFAYQLAVVVDDAFQKITHVVRGWDLLDSTPRQIYLQQQLGYARPDYAHIPVIVDAEGQKLSKQAFAPSIETGKASELIFLALRLLGQRPPDEIEREVPRAQLQWAQLNWNIELVPRVESIPMGS